MAEKKKPDLERREIPKQPPEVRRHNFFEVALGYTEELAVAEARRCIQCKKPQCVPSCPVEIDIPGFIGHIAKGDFQEGVRVLKSRNCLPAVCGRVCPQEEQCEKTCALKKLGGTVAIGRLERFLADWEAARGAPEMPAIQGPTGKKVAVVGGGPAGLTVAGDLIQLGYAVTIYEALHRMGGVLVYGIPEFRLPKAIVNREVQYLQQLGVKLVTDFVVGKTRTIDSLLEEYDAIFVGSGAGLPWFMEIPGENLNGVYSANEYLTRLNLMKGYRFPEYHTPIKVHKRVAVVGGGNVAMDCARSALRLGAESRIVYRRSREELPARLEEVENAEEEGVIFEFLTLPVRYEGDANGWVRRMVCQRMRLGEPDASGRRSPIPIEGDETVFEVDAVVCAIGNSPNPLIGSTTPGLTLGKKGNIMADEATGSTSRAKIWAGGDVVTGAATVILAMGAGRKAARAMHEYLCGS
ncbi:MAG TPA: NADPH-dependent glutamate synthase [Acidobacteriota bacterium]|nr:NADPH-dependent glutamate synthase [Acidobacteriota bacterium]HNR39600.1 NADPH-dependent glutamate synthase [Acidobacteriota bacterium]HNU00263.1 NADPH-dependent glutamate synthase [Acidobacteriota bacterium]HPB27708.1 NADPH-dependent glutamate synthase [Acidobacteriota bacterium]HQO25364.1 NADPH-dependent glutamate synthase [Acidobacteriota bacterium]